METITIPAGTLPKRKIWDIESSFKCALIGTCLNRIELRKLSQDKIFQTPPRLDDYQLHAHFIRISDHYDAAGRALHKYLEKKYRSEVKKYSKSEDEDEISALWDLDLAEGRIDSAWWSVLTHPYVSTDLLGRCYGQLHMLGHDCTCNLFRNRKMIDSLRAKTEMLTEVIGSERQHFRKERKQFMEENRKLKRDLEVSMRQNRELQLQKDEMPHLQDQIEKLKTENRSAHDLDLMNDLRQENNSLWGRIDSLTEKLDSLRKEFTHVNRQMQQLQLAREKMQQREEEQSREIAAMEAILFSHIGEKQSPCTFCSDKNTANCPGLNLCGKTVLYVGGLHKMVPHYRQLVEQSGGRFLHHDGGREASRSLLPKLMNTADAVLCPIDCVSHDACNCVKKMCKRYQKPFVPMRSSGLSSLARGLGQIVQ